MPAIHADGAGEMFKAAIGAPAPDFTLTSAENEDWRLSNHRGRVVVLLFYPQNETFVCTRQLCSVRDNWENYLETKAVIVGISPATPKQHRIFSHRRQLPMPLLADPLREVTGVYSRHWLYPVNLTRAIVVVDAEGIVRSREIMLRAFRPADEAVLASIYAARGDALTGQYAELKQRLKDQISGR